MKRIKHFVEMYLVLRSFGHSRREAATDAWGLATVRFK